MRRPLAGLISFAQRLAAGQVVLSIESVVLLASLFFALFCNSLFLSGMLDGKTRFRRYTTPILKRKIFIGGVFLVLSLLLPAATQVGPQSVAADVTVLLLSAGCLVCSMFLGLLGASLLEAKFPG